MLAPYCLAFDENHAVSFTSFTCSDSIEDQMEWSYLALINGDSKLFIQFVKYLYDMLGKPVSENHAFGILDAVYFLGVVLDIPCLIPILTLMLGEVTGVPIHVYSLRIMNNEALSLPLRIAWAVNLLPNEHLFEAILTLFRNSAQMDRLQFVGLGRHPDSLCVLSDYLYVSRDCQIIAHLLLASRCLEDDKEVPSLYDLFPTRFVDSCDEIETLLHMARSELSRYTIILSRLKEFTLRKKILNMVPDLEPENHLTKLLEMRKRKHLIVFVLPRLVLLLLHLYQGHLPLLIYMETLLSNQEILMAPMEVPKSRCIINNKRKK
uniref:Vps8 domain-containing protein n=1 Tax=Heterorhabditis bacteriophora TaxID=37862 RepID=A0A1I7XEA5_HETBA